MSEELFSGIQNAIVELNEQALSDLTGEVLAAGVNPVKVIEEAYTVGIQRVGKLFEDGDYFLPELIAAAEMVKDSVDRLQKTIPKGSIKDKGVFLIGTVAGDIHDIGKNLVATMLSTQGIKVIDIGVDCPVDKFIDRALEEEADIIGASCLLTMTAPEQKKLVDRLRERGLRDRFKVIVGGAAVDHTWARDIGSDGYAADLKEAVDVALSMLAAGKGQLA
ncbi:MAG: cobalamin B12-binding domain-containing protein [Chloroflexi bacterium]|nr:cobalamin B12-binding domain-containing protein [Chloroflexota bacterium]